MASATCGLRRKPSSVHEEAINWPPASTTAIAIEHLFAQAWRELDVCSDHVRSALTERLCYAVPDISTGADDEYVGSATTPLLCRRWFWRWDRPATLRRRQGGWR